MNFFPAVDLKNGQVVRLLKGDYNKITVYGEDPMEVAREFQDAGAEYLHVVDLDGAIEGNIANFQAIRDIIQGTDLKVEIGGGVRDDESIVKFGKIGALRVIIGTMAVEDPEFTSRMIKKHGPNVAVGVDIVNGNVAIQGWTKVTDTSADDLFRNLIDEGVHTIICTDIHRDGSMEGANINLYSHLVKEYKGYVDIIAAGGISSMEEIRQLHKIGLNGVIIGRALYTGAIDLSEAIRNFGD